MAAAGAEPSGLATLGRLGSTSQFLWGLFSPHSPGWASFQRAAGQLSLSCCYSKGFRRENRVGWARRFWPSWREMYSGFHCSFCYHFLSTWRVPGSVPGALGASSHGWLTRTLCVWVPMLQKNKTRRRLRQLPGFKQPHSHPPCSLSLHAGLGLLGACLPPPLPCVCAFSALWSRQARRTPPTPPT